MARVQQARLATLPNLLTVSRIAAAPLLAAAYFAENRWLAAALVVFAALSDLLDGILARATMSASDFGAALDPIADKVFIIAALALLLADGLLREAGAWAVFVIIWRELLISGLRERARTEGFAMPVLMLAKAKTALQFLATIALFASRIPDLNTEALACWGTILLWAAAALTLYTGADYLWQAWRRTWK